MGYHIAPLAEYFIAEYTSVWTITMFWRDISNQARSLAILMFSQMVVISEFLATVIAFEAVSVMLLHVTHL
jgi:hypothetical protein